MSSLVSDMQSWNGMRGQRQRSRGVLSSRKSGELRVADNMFAVHKFGILRHVLSEQSVYPEMVRCSLLFLLPVSLPLRVHLCVVAVLDNGLLSTSNYAYSECFTLEVQFPVSTYYQYDCWTAPGMLTALGSYTDQPGASSDVAPPLMTVTATAVVTASGGGGNTNNNNNNNVNNININLQSATVAPAGGGGGPLVKTAGAVGRRGNVWFGCVVTLVLLFVVG